MIYYISSTSYQPVITSVINEKDLILAGSLVDNEVYLNKYIKEHISMFNGIDMMLIDLSCVMDLEDEIIEAFEMLKVMYNDIRIILLASGIEAGSELLKRVVTMSIFDIVNSSDFAEIKSELKICVTSGKTYREAIKFREKKQEETAKESTALKKKIVNRIMIGVAGCQSRIGVTHNCIVIANTLRRMGYMVALLEMSSEPTFENIKESFDEKQENAYFELNGIHFYPGVNAADIPEIMGRAYNFIIIDFGRYADADTVMFNKCDVPVIMLGSKPWEMDKIKTVYGNASYDNVLRYYFLFNFTDVKNRADITAEMRSNAFKHVYFTPVTIDPYSAVETELISEMFGEYVITDDGEPKKKKKGILSVPWKKRK